MLIAVVQYHDDYDISLLESVLVKADRIELRLDFAKNLNLHKLAQLRRALSIPVIFTLRKSSQGGYYQLDETTRLLEIEALCKLQPDYFDLEYDIPLEFIRRLHDLFPQIKLICSYHNFQETPQNLAEILQKMQDPSFDFYKIATHAQSSLDALRMLKFVLDHTVNYQLTGLCMGEEGQSTRILGPVVGNAMHYACLSDQSNTAPGQLTLDELINIYHIKKLNRQTQIYALLGDPVSHSVGHILHNKAIALLDKNAVYIKLRVTENLDAVLAYCRSIHFAGLSITMPLKEMIVPFLDDIDSASQKIKAINTITFNAQTSQMCGLNTDGKAVVNLLKQKIALDNQIVIIFGAGGAARAIAYELIQAGVRIHIFNRTLERALKLSHELGCEGHSFDDLAQLKLIPYSVIINTLPNHS